MYDFWPNRKREREAPFDVSDHDTKPILNKRSSSANSRNEACAKIQQSAFKKAGQSENNIKHD